MMVTGTVSLEDRALPAVREAMKNLAGIDGVRCVGVRVDLDAGSLPWKEGDPATLFVYVAEGELYVGSLEDYRSSWREAHYADLEVRSEVWIWDPAESMLRPSRVKVEVGPYNDSDYATATLTLEATGEMTFATLDGRA